MSYREEIEQGHFDGVIGDGRSPNGAPAGARQNVRADVAQGAPARPGGATQNSGGAIEGNADESGSGPGRGAD